MRAPARPDRALAYAAIASFALHAFALWLSAPAPRQLAPARSAALIARVVETPTVETVAPPAPKRAKRVARKAVPTFTPVQAAPAAAIVEAPAAADSPPELRQSVATAVAMADSMSVAQYRQQLITAALRYKRYPPDALDNAWQGDVLVRLSVAASGALSAVSVEATSGHRVLDAHASEMFRKAAAEVPVPPTLRGQEFVVDVRAVYALER